MDIKNPEVMPNLMLGVITSQVHQVPLNPACPKSGNPKQGSYIEIAYEAKEYHLEIYALRQFVDSFKGGLTYPEPSKRFVVRDQEHMIQFISQYCSDVLGVEVKATAHLILSDGVDESKMTVTAIASPSGNVQPVISKFAQINGN